MTDEASGALTLSDPNTGAAEPDRRSRPPCGITVRLGTPHFVFGRPLLRYADAVAPAVPGPYPALLPTAAGQSWGAVGRCVDRRVEGSGETAPAEVGGEQRGRQRIVARPGRVQRELDEVQAPGPRRRGIDPPPDGSDGAVQRAPNRPERRGGWRPTGLILAAVGARGPA